MNTNFTDQLISILTFVLSLLGSLGNFLTIFICLHKELRKVPTFVFMKFVAALNILKLVSVLLFIHFLKYSLNNVFENSLIKYVLIIFLWQHHSEVYLQVNKFFKLNNKF